MTGRREGGAGWGEGVQERGMGVACGGLAGRYEIEGVNVFLTFIAAHFVADKEAHTASGGLFRRGDVFAFVLFRHIVNIAINDLRSAKVNINI